eukprot:jgi/Astpho2/9296/gw1.00139.88.1_t
MKANSEGASRMAEAFSPGLMVCKSMTANGRTTKCTAKASIPGLMAPHISASIRRTSGVAEAFITQPM